MAAVEELLEELFGVDEIMELRMEIGGGGDEPVHLLRLVKHVLGGQNPVVRVLAGGDEVFESIREGSERGVRAAG